MSQENFCSLANSGSNCYANVCLQLLYSIKKLRDYIINIPNATYGSNFLMALKLLFETMTTQRGPLDPTPLINACSNWNPHNPEQQQDCQEFLLSLLNELKENLQNDLIDDLFNMTVVQHITSPQINVPSRSMSDYFIFDIPVQTSNEASTNSPIFHHNLLQSTRNEFQAESVQYNMTEATLTKKINVLPPFLVFSIKRFKFCSGQTFKIQNKFEYPEDLDLREFLWSTSEVVYRFEGSTKYILRGVIAHRGTASEGHYVIFLKSQTSGDWFEFNDSLISPSSSNVVLGSLFGPGDCAMSSRTTRTQKSTGPFNFTAYQLVYENQSLLDQLNLTCFSMPPVVSKQIPKKISNHSNQKHPVLSERPNTSASKENASLQSFSEKFSTLLQSESASLSAYTMDVVLQVIQSNLIDIVHLRPTMTFVPQKKVMPDVIFTDPNEQISFEDTLTQAYANQISELILHVTQNHPPTESRISQIIPQLSIKTRDPVRLHNEILQLLDEKEGKWRKRKSKFKCPGKCSKCHEQVDDTWVTDIEKKINLCWKCFSESENTTGSKTTTKAKSELNEFECPVCNKKFAKKSTLNRHKRIHLDDKPFACPQCPFTTKYNGSLQSHLIQAHSDIRPFKCGDCGYAAKTKQLLSAHSKVHLSGVEKEKVKKHKCPHCSYKCLESGTLKIHLRTHNGEKPFTCPHCPYKTTRSGSLKVHIARRHTGEKKFQCELCDYSSVSSGDLNVHMRTHTGEKPFPCLHCPFKATQSGILKDHIAHSHTKEKKFKCEFCDYASVTSSNLNSHMRTHTGEKPYKCPFEGCKYSAAHPSALKLHEMIHRGERPWKCPQCDYSAIQKFNLKRHLKKHEKNSISKKTKKKRKQS